MCNLFYKRVYKTGITLGDFFTIKENIAHLGSVQCFLFHTSRRAVLNRPLDISNVVQPTREIGRGTDAPPPDGNQPDEETGTGTVTQPSGSGQPVLTDRVDRCFITLLLFYLAHLIQTASLTDSIISIFFYVTKKLTSKPYARPLRWPSD